MRDGRTRVANGNFGEQIGDRIAAGDDVVVGNAYVARRAGIDREEPERIDPARRRKRDVDAALDRRPERLVAIGTTIDHLELGAWRAAFIVVLPSRGIEREAGEPARGEHGVDVARKAHSDRAALRRGRCGRRCTGRAPATAASSPGTG